MTDQELLQAYARTSDVESLDTFIERHQTPLVRFAAQIVGDSDLAQDVVQDVFLRVAKHPHKLDGVESCRNWLLRVVRNAGIDQIRKRKRERRHMGEVAKTRPLQSDARPSQRLERAELRTRIEYEVSKLSDMKRELFFLKVQEQKSYKEIADITGLTVTNVGYHLHTIMRTLADQLDDLREELFR